MAEHSMDDYVVAIWRATRKRRTATTGDVARLLRVTPSSASYMFKRLAGAGLAQYRRYGGVVLTPAGAELARRRLRSRELWQRFLSEALGLPPEQAQAAAREIQYSLPDDVAGRLAALLDAVRTHALPLSGVPGGGTGPPGAGGLPGGT